MCFKYGALLLATSEYPGYVRTNTYWCYLFVFSDSTFSNGNQQKDKVSRTGGRSKELILSYQEIPWLKQKWSQNSKERWSYLFSAFSSCYLVMGLTCATGWYATLELSWPWNSLNLGPLLTLELSWPRTSLDLETLLTLELSLPWNSLDLGPLLSQSDPSLL